LKIWTNDSGTRENALVGCIEGENAPGGNIVFYYFSKDFEKAISKTTNPKQVYKDQFTVLSIQYQKFPEYGGLLHYILFGLSDDATCWAHAQWMVENGADLRQFIGVESGLTGRIHNAQCQQYLKSEFDKVVPNK
jgi:hypothetical protein